MVTDEEEVQNLTNIISSAILKFLQEEEKEVLQKNSNKYQSSQLKGKKNIKEEQQHIYLKIESFYDQLVNLLDKLKKIMKRMNTMTKITKPKLNIFISQLTQFGQELSNLIQAKIINLRIDRYVVALVEETNKALTQCDRILTSLEKQSNAFCCGRNEDTKYTFYRSIINIIGYGHVWAFVPRFSPVVQEKIERVEIYTPIKYDRQALQKIIQYFLEQCRKQISKYWPEEHIRQVQVLKEVKCQKQHVDSQIIESKQSAVSSLSESEEQEVKVVNQQPANNCIEVEERAKLKQDLQIERLLREAHEKLFGFGRSQQINQAIETYKKITDKKSEKSNLAFNSLGQIYEQGKFTSTDRQKSEEYYRRSASMNDPQGLYKLGKYIEKGMIKLNELNHNSQIVRNDQIRAAVEYYEKAASMNHLDAITDLGYIYEKGIQNETQNLKVSTISKSLNSSQISKNTDTNSQFFIQPNLNYALKYYKIAKKAEYPRAINNLGALLIQQHDSIPQRVKGTNLQKGIKYLKRATQLNYPKAYFNLAKCYEHGIGVKQNYDQAKKYYQRGSQKGDLACKVQFIKCFFSDGFPKNAQTDDCQLAKLIELVREVLIIDPNNKQCLFYMGLFHERGDGVIQNPQIAYNYVCRSASLNFLPAITKLGDYKYSGFYTKKDLPEAIQLYEKAANGGDPQAMINLSLILEKGLIKPNSGSSSNHVKHLQNQAMKKNSSNAFLIAGLREQNYRIKLKSNRQLNEKIMKSLQLGNRDAVNLVEKTQTLHLKQKQVKKQQEKPITERTMYPQLKTDRTLPFSPKPLKKMRSFQNFKTFKN